LFGLLVAGEPVGAVVDSEAEDEGCEGDGQDVEMADDEGGQTEAPCQGDDQGDHFEHRSADAPAENDEQDRQAG